MADNQPMSPEQVIAAQRAAVQKQIQEAKARDRAQFGPAVSDPAVAVEAATRFTQSQSSPASQQQPQQVQQQRAATPQQQGFNLPQGMTPQQIAQGLPRQMNQPQQPASLQDAASSKQDPDKPKVRWHPGRNSQLEIELEDSIVTNLIESFDQESDPQAKVVAALLSEILSLRARVSHLEQGGMGAGRDEELMSRVYRLEATLFEQTQSLNAQAKAAREEAEHQAQLELDKKNEGEESS